MAEAGGRRRKKGRTQTAFRLDAEAVQLEHDAEELSEWFNEVVGTGEFKDRDTFLENLNTGTILCDLMFKLFPEHKSKVFDDAEPGTFQARDNISKFLAACKDLGLAESSLFTADDLVERASDKAVFATLQLVREKAPEVQAEEKAAEEAGASVEDVDAGDAAAGGDEDVPPTEAFGQDEDDDDAGAAEPAADEPAADEPAAEEPAPSPEPTAEEPTEPEQPSPVYQEMDPKCSFCAKDLLGKKFKCGGCAKKIWYCDRTCQRKDWREHKKVCERRHKQ